MSNEITAADLQEQAVELLPERAALGGWGGHHWANVYASNTAMAFNAGAFHSHANAGAFQTIGVWQ
jgi:hypothetical protein